MSAHRVSVAPDPAAPAGLASLVRDCDDTGRWGSDDQAGRLNLIGAAERLAALQLIREGSIVALGRPIRTGIQATSGATLTVRADGTAAIDELSLRIHGFDITHLDALGHNAFAGRLYNDRQAASAWTASGLSFADVTAAATGVLARGVLLDVAALRGVDQLPAGTQIGANDLAASARRAGVQLAGGDAVFVHGGYAEPQVGLRRAASGRDDVPSAARLTTAVTGLSVEAIAWLCRQDIAIYSGDCIEALPGPTADLTMPLHQLGLARAGLWILDNPDLPALVAACRARARTTFALIIAPLWIEGGTGSAVNPLALF